MTTFKVEVEQEEDGRWLGERARLAQRLISSLDQEEGDADVDKLWFQEAERRLGELKPGKVAGISAEKVIRKARAALR